MLFELMSVKRHIKTWKDFTFSLISHQLTLYKTSFTTQRFMITQGFKQHVWLNCSITAHWTFKNASLLILFLTTWSELNVSSEITIKSLRNILLNPCQTRCLLGAGSSRHLGLWCHYKMIIDASFFSIQDFFLTVQVLGTFKAKYL